MKNLMKPLIRFDGQNMERSNQRNMPRLPHLKVTTPDHWATDKRHAPKKNARKVDVAQARRDAKKLNQHLQECSKTSSMCATTTMTVTSWLKHDTARGLADNEEKPLIRPDGQHVDREKQTEEAQSTQPQDHRARQPFNRQA